MSNYKIMPSWPSILPNCRDTNGGLFRDVSAHSKTSAKLSLMFKLGEEHHVDMLLDCIIM